jgi:hypothetical protein
MTEDWWWNQSIEGKKPLWQTWQELFGITAKGVHTLFRYHAYLHDKVTSWTMPEHNAFIIKQAKWFKANSGPGCLYNAHYAWNTNNLWKTEDISHPDYILYIDWMRFRQHEVDTPTPLPPVPPTQPQDNPMQPAILSGKNARVNIRAERSIESAILGIIPASPDSVTGFAADVDNIAFNGYVWRKIEVIKDSISIAGYVADTFVTVTPPPGEHDLAIWIAALQLHIDTLKHEIQGLTDELDNLENTLASLPQ